MRLLLEELYSPQIAQQLRERGHDVVAVGERLNLGGVGGHELLERMASEGRVILSENAVDFVVLAGQAALAGQEHAGILLTSPRRLPRRMDTIGLFVRTLDAFLEKHPAKDACQDQVLWLS